MSMFKMGETVVAITQGKIQRGTFHQRAHDDFRDRIEFCDGSFIFVDDAQAERLKDFNLKIGCACGEAYKYGTDNRVIKDMNAAIDAGIAEFWRINDGVVCNQEDIMRDKIASMKKNIEDLNKKIASMKKNIDELRKEINETFGEDKGNTSILINGNRYEIEGDVISYDQVVEIVYGSQIDTVVSIAFSRDHDDRSGILFKDKQVRCKDGTIINAVITGNA